MMRDKLGQLRGSAHAALQDAMRGVSSLTAKSEQLLGTSQVTFAKQMRDKVTVYRILEWAVALDTEAQVLVQELKIRTVLRQGMHRANAERIIAEGWLHRLNKQQPPPQSHHRRGQIPKPKMWMPKM